MPRTPRNKPLRQWLRTPIDSLPHAPSHDRYIIVEDEAGRWLYIDADLDYLFKRDDGRMTRRVWTENGTAYTEIYETDFNSPQEQKPRKIKLEAFVWETWHAEKLPRWIVGFEHGKGGACDFRINNLEPVIDRALMPKSKPKKRKAA